MRVPVPLRLAPLVAIATLVVGCAGSPAASPSVDAASVTVVGLTRRDGVAPALNRGAAALDLVARLSGGERRRLVAGPERVRAMLGAEAHAALLSRHARDGRLDEEDLQRLAAAPLGTRFALLVRLEADAVSELEPRAEPVRDATGRALADRFVVHRAVRRETTLSAELVDLADARSRWRRAYAAAPLTHREDVRYRGSSFGGSVAALLANTVVNGPAAPGGPAPPSLRTTLRSLFDELERALPDR